MNALFPVWFGKLQVMLLSGIRAFCQPAVFWVIPVLLVLSLSLNIFCVVSKCCSGKRTCRSRRRGSVNNSSQRSQQMEDNPIYGNVHYMQTKTDSPHSSPASSSLKDRQRVSADSQSKSQDCYANLALKAPRPQSGHSAPQIQYSDVIHLEELRMEEGGSTGNAAAVSDLYASVQTHRTKIVDTAESAEGYANHI